ncbi:hypothetical protein [Candidatus Symbiopectobacterium sp. 'North America']|uniref:hypothetical protein n=1 Tax=Candidatus Symbiopectobacterium sp. 'North America' TaxID=2794574 RepID=UPI0018CA4152|nr:hypothetical protein [Candidatus Symbiopectobacterium sp. 'North America']
MNNAKTKVPAIDKMILLLDYLSTRNVATFTEIHNTQCIILAEKQPLPDVVIAGYAPSGKIRKKQISPGFENV